MTTAQNLFKMLLSADLFTLGLNILRFGDIKPAGKGQKGQALKTFLSGMEGFGFCPELFIPVAAGGRLPVLISGCEAANPPHD